ncbi:MAG TPA: Trp biosynthesis-associated membrane protein [Pseudonocardiaceae bacterium]|nr:Trp biosynthesis-associated membrane protein [Pseudonocardiaceae bacterium]
MPESRSADQAEATEPAATDHAEATEPAVSEPAGGEPAVGSAAGVNPARQGSRRPLWMIILALLVGAGLLWASSKLDWSWSAAQTSLRGKVVSAQDGAADQPALVPLALLALAAIAALLATGGWLRRIVGGLVVLAGLGTIAATLTRLSGIFGAHPNGYPLLQVVTAHALAVLAGLLVGVAGVLLIRAANRLPRLGANYETPGATKRKRDPDAELWEALSGGDDPTVRE